MLLERWVRRDQVKKETEFQREARENEDHADGDQQSGGPASWNLALGFPENGNREEKGTSNGRSAVILLHKLVFCSGKETKKRVPCCF